jgi:hypothetical protein
MFHAKAVQDGKPSDNIRSYTFYCLILLLLSVVIFHVQETAAETVTALSPVVRVISEPEAISPLDGQVIYRHTEAGIKHLYIVGISHRDALTRSNGRNTTQVQSEVYRIGKWLIENEGIELLLPEGYFTTRENMDKTRKNDTRQDDLKTVLSDRDILKKLNSSIYANAEGLLWQSHNIMIQQVENYRLYNEVAAKISKLEKGEKDEFALLYEKLELDYLQGRRTAAILQVIPGIIDHQVKLGNIRHGNAMLTIGASHLSQIIECLKQKKLVVRSPAFTPFKDYSSEVNLLNEGFDITVIIPRSIADDGDLMSLMKLASHKGQSLEALTANKSSGINR